MDSSSRQEMMMRHLEQNKTFYIVNLVLIGLIVAFFVGLILFRRHHDDFGLNLFTEFLGIAITVAGIDVLRAYRARKRNLEELKLDLVRQAGSRVNQRAVSAVEQLREKGWLTGDGGLLRGADLYKANLEGAHLEDANLEGAYLVWANLKHSDLERANMHGALLERANLNGASMWSANLQEADLERASLNEADLHSARLEGAFLEKARLQDADLRMVKLSGADLSSARLKGADLSDANLQKADLFGAALQNANLNGANLDEAYLSRTTLPNWDDYSDDTDMRKFTDPCHIEFADTVEMTNRIRKSMGLEEWVV